jgi:hypothetical protein
MEIQMEILVVFGAEEDEDQHGYLLIGDIDGDLNDFAVTDAK